jgi:phage shock protein PspC (stress-responsive transcriptional regulator)
MEQNDTTTESAPPTAPELVRPREGRMIAGVAQGFANRYDIPVVWVRILLVLLSFGGGLGVALYAAGWFLIRSEEEPDAPAERFFSGASTSRSWIGIALVFIAVLILLDNFTFLSGGIVWAVGLLVVGILLYTGDLPRLVNQPPDDGGPATTPTPMSSSAVTTAESPTAPQEAGTTASPARPPRPARPTPPILPARPAIPREPSYLGRITIGMMLIGMGILAILDNIPTLALEPQPRHYMALAVTILGLGLVVGGFAGRARGLILLGIVLVPTMLFSPVFEYNWNSEDFNREIRPVSFAELEDSYVIDVGSILIDLRRLPWDGEEIDLDVEVDAGNIEIIIPEGVGLIGEASLDVGQVTALDQVAGGVGGPSLAFDQPGLRGTLVLSAVADVGNINIING